MHLGAAEELKIETAARAVNDIVVASLGASIAVSVAATIGATMVTSSSAAVAGAAGAATGSASGGAAGAVGGGGGGGGGAGSIVDVATVLMAVQRLSVLASMPVGKSKMHVRVGETLAWAKGSLGLFPQIVSEDVSQYWGWGDQPRGGRGVGAAGREAEAREAGDNATSSNSNAEAVEENEQLLWHNALKGLIDTSTCLVFGLGLVRLVRPNRTLIHEPIFWFPLNLPTFGLYKPHTPILYRSTLHYFCFTLIQPAHTANTLSGPFLFLQVLLLQLIVQMLWNHCVNRKYYVRRNQMRIQEVKVLLTNPRTLEYDPRRI